MTPEVQAEIQREIASHDFVVFMKGTRKAPACGFSGRTVELLDTLLSDYHSVDVLARPELREAVKEFSSWPTLPQLYVRGRFLGGADIIAQSFEEGTLDEMLGLETRPRAPLNLTLSTRARDELGRYLADSEECVLIDVDAEFVTGLSIGPNSPTMVIERVDGISFALDRLSASRAVGLHIDFVETPSGGAFKIENPNEPPKVKQLTALTLKAWMDRGEDFVLIDVRTPGEWATARIVSARLLDDAVTRELENEPSSRKLVFLCHHGHRSQRAAEHFVRLGRREVFNLVGGIDAWSQQVDESVPRY
jgi:monothiol glutaredoxin